MLSALHSTNQKGIRTIDIVQADNNFFLHKQIQQKDGRTYMRLKKRKLLA